MTCGPLAQAGDCLTLEPWGGGASPPEPHKGVRGTGWGALGRRTSPSPPPHAHPAGQAEAGQPPAVSSEPTASFIRTASSQCCVGFGQAAEWLSCACVCVWAHACVWAHVCVLFQVLVHHRLLQDTKCSSLCGSSRTLSLT